MHVEPDIDLAALRARLIERYAMDVVRLEFVPMGIDSWSYVAVSEDGAGAFRLGGDVDEAYRFSVDAIIDGLRAGRSAG